MINELVNSLRELKNKRQNKPQLVDLGLPSGNLWMTQNMGASCETEYGLYYQFGSLIGYYIDETLEYSYWKTHPFNNGKDMFDKEYFLKNRYNWLYKNGILKPEYDIVTQTYGDGYKIPEPKDFQELLDYTTTTESIEDYKMSGASGCLFTSKINGNTLFIPFSGYAWNGSFEGVGDWCSLWSCKLNSGRFSCFAFDLYCHYYNPDRIGLISSEFCHRFPLRGIKVK